MYVTLFALLSISGAWVAWRSNPLYSNRATLRFVSIVGLAAATAIGAIGTAVNLAINRPAPSAMGILTGACLIGTAALIWLIVKGSAPVTAVLPAATHVVHVHRAQLYPWVRRFGWTMLGLAILAMSIRGDGRFVVFTVGGMLVFLGVVFLFGGYVSALNLDRSLTAVESHPWVHWRYTPAQWKEWTDVQADRAVAAPPDWRWRRDWTMLTIPLVAVTVSVFVFDPGTWLWKVGYVGVCFGVIVGIIALVRRCDEAAPQRARMRLMKAAPEAYFGAGGIFVDGVYTQWQTVGGYLVEAAVDERKPRSLVFRFEKTVPDASGTSTEIRQSVLIPADAGADIARLNAALSATCPSARISLS